MCGREALVLQPRLCGSIAYTACGCGAAYVDARRAVDAACNAAKMSTQHVAVAQRARTLRAVTMLAQCGWVAYTCGAACVGGSAQ
jgi:hypothetical protein